MRVSLGDEATSFSILVISRQVILWIAPSLRAKGDKILYSKPTGNDRAFVLPVVLLSHSFEDVTLVS